ncbi:MAG: 4Fe-4S dicluster domain-containing protein [Dehalococcoidia bacterium]|nr:4Fe-4S dicluster domain-containing protein [Dehalococcoidia bacterium]
MAEKSILYDATRCTACRGCQVACKQWNENNEEWKTGQAKLTTNWGSYENPPDLSPQTWLKLKFIEVDRGGKLDWLFTRQACMHCTDAACVKVCPTGSLYRHELGFVSYDKSICSGCGYCVDFCPFKVPRSTRNVVTGIAKADKCTLCTTPALDRLAAGQEPACVKTCPPKALVYGDRAQLLAQGKTRVEELRNKGYSSAYLYGDKELGGLHVMYVLNDSPEVYGLPANPELPAAAVAWKDVMQPLGWAIAGLAGLGLVLNYVMARKAKIENGELAKK